VTSGSPSPQGQPSRSPHRSPNPGNLGTVTFKDNGVAITGGVNIALVGGVASVTTSTLSLGNHSITAV